MNKSVDTKQRMANNLNKYVEKEINLVDNFRNMKW